VFFSASVNGGKIIKNGGDEFKFESVITDEFNSESVIADDRNSDSVTAENPTV
jgi:hypothetical protein